MPTELRRGADRLPTDAGGGADRGARRGADPAPTRSRPGARPEPDPSDPRWTDPPPPRPRRTRARRGRRDDTLVVDVNGLPDEPVSVQIGADLDDRHLVPPRQGACTVTDDDPMRASCVTSTGGGRMGLFRLAPQSFQAVSPWPTRRPESDRLESRAVDGYKDRQRTGQPDDLRVRAGPAGDPDTGADRPHRADRAADHDRARPTGRPRPTPTETPEPTETTDRARPTEPTETVGRPRSRSNPPRTVDPHRRPRPHRGP